MSGDQFHEKVIAVFADLYEYNQSARICVWAQTQTQAKVRIGKYEIFSKDFREKRKAVEDFFQGLVGKIISFQQLEKTFATHAYDGEPLGFFAVHDLPSEFFITIEMIMKMPAHQPSPRW